jgi:hypothetical protein
VKSKTHGYLAGGVEATQRPHVAHLSLWKEEDEAAWVFIEQETPGVKDGGFYAWAPLVTVREAITTIAPINNPTRNRMRTVPHSSIMQQATSNSNIIVTAPAYLV